MDETKEDEKTKSKIRDLNDLGYSELILSFADTDSGNVAFQYVRNSKSKEYEDGNIAVAWASLQKKYAPKTAPTEMGLYRKFYDSKLKKGMDPDVWISTMEDTRMRLSEMKSEMTDKHFLMHLINNLTSEYEHIITVLEKRLDDAKEPLTIEELRADLNLKYERLNLRKKEKDEDSEEKDNDIALAAYGKFKGKCRKCGKIGHKATDCRVKLGRANVGVNVPDHKRMNGHDPNKNKSSNNDGWIVVRGKGTSFDGTCNYCKKYGHRYADCSKRIYDEKSGVKTENAHLSSAWCEEVMLMATPVGKSNYYDSLSEDEEEEDELSTNESKNMEVEVEVSEKQIKKKKVSPNIPSIRGTDPEGYFEMMQIRSSPIETKRVSPRLHNIEQKKSVEKKPATIKVKKNDKNDKIKEQMLEIMTFRKTGAALKHLPGKSLKEIANTKQLRVNGTRKQRDVLELKDFRIFIEEFVCLTFKRNH